MAASPEPASRNGKRQYRQQARRAGKSRQLAAAIADAESGKLNPRSVRYQMSQGKMALRAGKPPTPPEEWSAFKRRRLQRCLDAALLFLRGREHEEIARSLGMSIRRVGSPKGENTVTKQYISQLVERGVDFFLQRGFVSTPKA